MPQAKLRAVRHERASFEPRFWERHPDFWPIARAAACFAGSEDWPDVADYGRAFEGPAPVRFEEAPPKRRRPPGPIARDDLYDAVIVQRHIVPTRPRMWHDFLNALVWATFPRAKMALHRRQHVAIERWIPEGATRLPNARTRELDALALLDEGGVLVLNDGAPASSRRVVFGHALFEGLVFEQPAMLSAAVTLDAPGQEVDGACLAAADEALSALLDDTTRFVTPSDLSRTTCRGDATRGVR